MIKRGVEISTPLKNGVLRTKKSGVEEFWNFVVFLTCLGGMVTVKLYSIKDASTADDVSGSIKSQEGSGGEQPAELFLSGVSPKKVPPLLLQPPTLI
jgi:hypothetical protein